MRSLLISGVALGAITIFSPAAFADAPGATGMGMHKGGGTTIVHRWGTRINGRWLGGVQAPGGWAAYRRPVIGAVVPTYWIDRAFTIGDYRIYGLPHPQPGFVWARYYDDAVLLDRSGRIYDSRRGIDWDNYEGGYSDGRYADRYGDAGRLPPRYLDGGYPGGPPPPTRRGDVGDTVAGAVVGGVAGGVLGNVVAGRGDRTAGTIVGATLGAVAGAAIASGNDRDRPRGAPPPPPGAMRRDDGRRDGGRHDDDRYDGGYDAALRDDSPMHGPSWMGREVPPHLPPVLAQPPSHRPPSSHPHVKVHGGSGQPHVTSYTTHGYAAGGYWYPGTTVTTITFPPQVTSVTTTRKVTYTTKKVVRKKPASKPRCKC